MTLRVLVLLAGLVTLVRGAGNWNYNIQVGTGVFITLGSQVLNFYFLFFKTLFVPRVRRVRSPTRDFYFMYNIWQAAENRTRVTATAARCS